MFSTRPRRSWSSPRSRESRKTDIHLDVNGDVLALSATGPKRKYEKEILLPAAVDQAQDAAELPERLPGVALRQGRPSDTKTPKTNKTPKTPKTPKTRVGVKDLIMPGSPARAGAPPLTLRVAEALAKDVGRGIARLDPDSMEGLRASIGDVVAITGERATALKLMPAYPDARGQGAHPDRRDRPCKRRRRARRAGRGGAGRCPGRPHRDPVAYRQVAADAAGQRRFLRRTAGRWPRRPGRRPIPGRSLRITAAGFHRGEHDPPGLRLHPGRDPHPDDRRGAERRTVKISYEDIGGLGKTIARIREMSNCRCASRRCSTGSA